MTEISIDIRKEPGERHSRHIYIDNEYRGKARYNLSQWNVVNAVGHMVYWPRDTTGGHYNRHGPVSARHVDGLMEPIKRAFELGLLPPKAMLDAEIERSAAARRLAVARDDYNDLIAREARTMLRLLRRIDTDRNWRVRCAGPLQDEVAALVERLKVPVIDGKPIEENSDAA